MRFLVAVLAPLLVSVAALPGSHRGERSNIVGASISNTRYSLGEQSSPSTCLQDDLSDLEYLRNQLRELQVLIGEKKLAISSRNGESLSGCDGVICAAKVHVRSVVRKWVLGPRHNYSNSENQRCRGDHRYHDSSSVQRRPNLSLPVCRYPQPQYSSHNSNLHGSGYRNNPSFRFGPRPQRCYMDSTSNGRLAFQYGTTFLLGFFLAFLLVALHRQFHSPVWVAKRAEYRVAYQLRRTERRNRQAARRAAFKQAIRRLLRPRRCQEVDELPEVVEKYDSVLDGSDLDSDAVSSTTMTDDISELRSVADMVSDLVAAEEGRSQASSPRVSIPSSRDGSIFETGSQMGDEPLPPYEHHDGSDISSSVSDGFMYTPGSSQYTPSQPGGADDILGPSLKD